MQLPNESFLHFVSVFRLLPVIGLLLGASALPLTAQTLSGIFQCQSIFMDVASSSNLRQVKFTTPSSNAGSDPQLPMNGELEYHPGDVNLYQSYWLMYQGNQLADRGLVKIGGVSLLLDDDFDGIPNFVERNLGADVVASIVVVSPNHAGPRNGTISLSRWAGQTSGKAVVRFNDGEVYNSNWSIPLMDVSGTYDLGKRTIQLRANSSTIEPGTLTANYQINPNNSVTLYDVVLQLDGGHRITSTPVTLARSGRTYRCIIEFADGCPAITSYPDFRRWILELTDPADSDGDGIPNFSDITSVGSSPSIVSQPKAVTVTAGQAAVFQVTATGTAPLGYQWQRNGVNVPGATTATLTINNAQAANAGDYRVVVSNGAGNVTSTIAKLTVNPLVAAPSIVSQPQAVTVTEGQMAVFYVTATGTEPLIYQWQHNGVTVPGGTTATLTINNAKPTDAGEYRVIISNGAVVVISSVAKLVVNTAGPEGFVWIPPGTFVMGSPTSEEYRDSDELQHPVTLTRGFWLLDHEVTQVEYQMVMGSNPSYFKGDTLPVEQVSWFEAVTYCQTLTERERSAGRITEQQAYRLPTEAEWEYAARAGTSGVRYGELDQIAWSGFNGGGTTHEVRGKLPNAWGLYDMIGNVWEWCGDWYGDYLSEPVTDPAGPESGTYRVFRGGDWIRGSDYARSANRKRLLPDRSDSTIGFRLVLSSIL